MVISIKLVFTVCSNDAGIWGAVEASQSSVCVCVYVAITVLESLHVQQKFVSTVTVSLNVLVDCRALEKM